MRSSVKSALGKSESTCSSSCTQSQLHLVQIQGLAKCKGPPQKVWRKGSAQSSLHIERERAPHFAKLHKSTSSCHNVSLRQMEIPPRECVVTKNTGNQDKQGGVLKPRHRKPGTYARTRPGLWCFTYLEWSRYKYGGGVRKALTPLRKQLRESAWRSRRGEAHQ